MKPSSRDKIIEGTEHAFVLAGSTDYDSAMAIFGKLLKWVQDHYHPMRSKSEFSAFLDAMPEPSWLEMRFILGAFRYMPQLVRHSLKRVAESMEEDFPGNPRGRPGLDAFTKAQIIAHVLNRFGVGYNLDQAKKSATMKFGVSVSTVQRAWDDRGNRGAVDFRSVLKYLEADAKDERDVLDARNESIP